MIAVEEAKRILMAHARVPATERCALASAGRAYLATDVHAPHDHPLFDMSAVDGYAFNWADGRAEREVVGEVAAGQVFVDALAPDQCIRIFTGALVPVSADTVVMQEHVHREGGRIILQPGRSRLGDHIRKQGEQLRRGDLVLTAGQRLDAVAMGLLASVGVDVVDIIPAPRGHVIITGDEFITGDRPAPGRIFSSNDRMLEEALRAAGVPCTVAHAPDHLNAIKEALQAVDSDVIVTTGGASVGDHDLIRAAIEELGGIVHVHGVAQKPGKPMLFATLGRVPILALPGNPRAVIVLFWEYVLPFLRACQGVAHPAPRSDRLPASQAIAVKGERAEFRAARVQNGQVTLLADEGSHMLRSLIEADALAYLPAEQRNWAIGEPVEVHYLPR